MAEPFIAEIRIMSFNFAPKGWAMCNGQLLPINQNQPLFALLGTTYGGDGRVNFALPDLRGDVAIHMGNGHTLGEKGGSQAVTINTQQAPQHIHFFNATTAAAVAGPPNNTKMFAKSNGGFAYQQAQNLVAMNGGMISNVGGNQPHENMQPYLVLNFCIALQGIFPSQT
jgi:microcystin-dependent protein